MRVGFIGLGTMGEPMARNLLRAGHVVAVYDVVSRRVQELARYGACGAGSAREAADPAELVLTCLPDVATSLEVFLGPQGLVQECRQGQVLVDHSTIGPATARRTAQAAQERGAFFLDAPVSGGVERARDGTLTMMVGGERAAFERALPVFQALAHSVHHVGPAGAGCVVKLVNQLLVAANVSSVAEAMVLGTKAGADPAVLFQVLRTSWGASTMLDRSVPRFLEGDFSGAAPIRLFVKDLGLVAELAREVGAPRLHADAARTLLAEAEQNGLESQDVTALVTLLERAAGVEVRRR